MTAILSLAAVQPILAGIAISIATTSAIPVILFTAVNLTLIAILVKNPKHKVMGIELMSVLLLYIGVCSVINMIAQAFFVYANPSVYNVGATILGYSLCSYGALEVLSND